MTVVRQLARIVLGTFMVAAGISHLTIARDEFTAQVPDWFPLADDPTILGSGIVEIALGAAFVFLPRRRQLVGLLLAAFFVVIVPGNIAQYVEGTDAFGLNTDRERFVRLLFQPVLIAWALWAGEVFRRKPTDF